MKIQFVCPSCGAAGAVDAAFAGKSARCRKCGGRFTIPMTASAAGEGYALAEPIRATAGVADSEPVEDSAFVPSPADEAATAIPRKPKRPKTTSSARRRKADSNWPVWLMRGGGTVVVLLAVIALLVPGGLVIAGSVVTIAGLLMLVLGYGVGAYGAFREDLIYGILYVFIPLYTGYYIVTRWDDLWVWFACSTAGVVLVVVGTGLLQWGGVGL
jgi:hypothetical protein